MGALCPLCAAEVALHEGLPIVTARGVELWHRSCYSIKDARPVEQVTVIAPRHVEWRRVVPFAAFAVVALASMAELAVARSELAPKLTAAVADVPVRESLPVPAQITAHDEATTQFDFGSVYPVPLENGQPLDELYPSLREWAHPVSDTRELMPQQSSRHFGAERIGIERPECGAGHCGVDLDGPRGQPIVAVADGTVVRVEHHELGLDGRSGRYVRIQHEDGPLTAYMHLDEIAEGLEVGDHVEAGQYIGTLGATAVYTAPPHLHFSLEIPNDRDMRGDISDTHYVDPAPFLVRATVLPAPDRRHPIKPAM